MTAYGGSQGGGGSKGTTSAGGVSGSSNGKGGDALGGARALLASIETLLAKPTPKTLDQARAAWRAARVPYLQSEAHRFANSVIDEWEPRVNA